MEELAVYAILCSVGYDFNKEYNKALDKLFLENQKNNDYLELEGMQQKRCNSAYIVYNECLFSKAKFIWKISYERTQKYL